MKKIFAYIYMGTKYVFKSISKFVFSCDWFLIQLVYEDFKNYIQKDILNKNNVLMILGNGPSLMIDMKKINYLTVTDYCAVNDFCCSSIFNEIKPKYYVLADPIYFFEEYRRSCVYEVFNALNLVDWNMNLYIPYSAWKVMGRSNDILLNNSFIKVVPYHTNTYNGFSSIKSLLFKKGLTMPIVKNVLISSIFNAINMGYKKILLCGVDHSWTEDIKVDSKNRVCLAEKHFYDEVDIKYVPFLTSFGSQYHMHEILHDFSITFEGYHQLSAYADVNNCEILNMTEKSFIDAFKRYY